MEPWEVMISESQERMVAIVAPERLADVEAVIDRWELHRAVIGEVTESGLLRATWEGEEVGAIPARLLTDECPRYAVEREPRVPPPERPTALPAVREALLELLASPALRSRTFVTRRYDQLVHSRTVRRPGLDAAVLRLRPDWRGLAVTLDGQGRIGSLDPRLAGQLVVLEAARNVACAGGEPIGFTDCLNFGNPEKPEIGWELAETIEGMALACEALGVPIVSGNVSLYNDTDGRTIPPTPAVGCVGLVADVRRVPRGWHEGDAILLARSRSPLTFAGSEAQARWGTLGGSPSLDLASECALVRHATRAGRHATLAHDAAEGGLAVALAEAALWSGVDASLDLDDDPLTLFGEVGGQVIVAVPAEFVEPDPTGADVDVRRIGTVGGDTLFGIPLTELALAHEGAA
jgi:phosphoribosylformylglycinamidine synthase